MCIRVLRDLSIPGPIVCAQSRLVTKLAVWTVLSTCGVCMPLLFTQSERTSLCSETEVLYRMHGEKDGFGVLGSCIQFSRMNIISTTFMIRYTPEGF
jgi:hypothetical protein